MTIHIGITGTRNGCTITQIRRLFGTLWGFKGYDHEGVFFHFGDCVGVDEQGFHLAKALGFRTISHPPKAWAYRAYCDAYAIEPTKPYMIRNRDIVKAVAVLIVVPAGPEADNPRSGTWATYRMAVKAGVETVVIEP